MYSVRVHVHVHAGARYPYYNNYVVNHTISRGCFGHPRVIWHSCTALDGRKYTGTIGVRVYIILL
jgi:hypothetical protein